MRLVSIYLVFTFGPILFIGYFFSKQNYNLIWENTADSTRQISEQMLSSISALFEDAQYFQKIVSEESVRRYLMSNDNTASYSDAKEILTVFDQYSNNSRYSNYINNIYLIGKHGKSICNRYGIDPISYQDLEKVHQEELLSFSQGAVLTTGNINPRDINQDNTYVYFGMPLVAEPFLEPFGAILLEMETKAFENICGEVRLAQNGSFSVLDANGAVLFGSELEREDTEGILSQMGSSGAGDFIREIDGADTLVVTHAIPMTDWTLVGHVAMQDLMRDAYQFRRTLWIGLLAVAAFSIGLYIFFSKRLILPLQRLKATMKMAAMGDKNVRYYGTTRDEINDVGESFNSMVVELQRIAQQNTQRQVALQKAELDLLQAQINPHFLYNTLDCILWQAQLNDNQSVIHTVEALASFFRTTLSKGLGWIFVEEEIEMIRNYLIIQKARYGEMLHWEIQVEPGLEKYKILKLTLQPIVENAIYHGIKNRSEGGSLRITGCSDGDFMIFEIRDDGVGMSPEVLERLKKKLDDTDFGVYDHIDRGFGLRNVHSRIRLYYGEDCGLEVESTEDVGTVVRVRIHKEVHDV